MLLNCGVGEDPWESLGLQIDLTSPKGNQPWIFIGSTDVEVETLTLWPPDVKNQLTGKDPDPGEDWGQEKGATKNKIVGWQYWFNGHEFEQTPGDSERQGSLVCCSLWGHKELDMTYQLNGNNIYGFIVIPQLFTLLRANPYTCKWGRFYEILIPFFPQRI